MNINPIQYAVKIKLMATPDGVNIVYNIVIRYLKNIYLVYQSFIATKLKKFLKKSEHMLKSLTSVCRNA